MASAKSGKSSEKSAGKSSGIQSLERAAAILRTVASHPEGIGLTDLSSQLKLHLSTTFHLTKTLVSLGFLVQIADTKRYQIGSTMFSLAASALNDNALRTLGTPILEKLSALTGESAYLAVRSHGDVMLIARTEPAGLMQMAERAGLTRPPHATAIGKVLLAHMQDSQLDQFLKTAPLSRYNKNTITEPKALRKELDTVRSKGYAVDRGEVNEELWAIAVPILDFSGHCTASMGLSAPVWRTKPKQLEQKRGPLQQAAEELSRALGYRE